MHYYLICRAKKVYVITGAVTDFGVDISESTKTNTSNFIIKAMVDNWKIEIIQESEAEKLGLDHNWTEFRSWMKI